MSPVVLTWVVVGLISLGIMAVVLLGLIKQLKRVAGSVGELSREIQPLLSDMQREAARARRSAEVTRQKAERIRDSRRRGGRPLVEPDDGSGGCSRGVVKLRVRE